VLRVGVVLRLSGGGTLDAHALEEEVPPDYLVQVKVHTVLLVASRGGDSSKLVEFSY